MVEVNISSRLHAFCEAHKFGVVLSSTNGIQCFPDQPRKVRKPDVSVYKKGRFTREHLMEGFVSIAPDLAVEVVSSNDEFAELIEKIEEYLATGVPLIWVIDPENEIAFIHRKDGTVTKLHKSDDLSGEDVLPGFACRLGDLFPDASMF
jgi:Uma2 family endonuclease